MCLILNFKCQDFKIVPKNNWLFCCVNPENSNVKNIDLVHLHWNLRLLSQIYTVYILKHYFKTIKKKIIPVLRQNVVWESALYQIYKNYPMLEYPFSRTTCCPLVYNQHLNFCLKKLWLFRWWTMPPWFLFKLIFKFLSIV